MRSIDGFLAKDGEPEPASVISPVLTERALKEFASRVPTAKKVEAKIRFVERVIAIVTVSYSMDDVSREQEVQFIHGDHQWNMFWIPASPKKNG